MNLLKDRAKRHASVASKGVAHSAAGAHERRGGEEHADQGKHEKTCASGTATGGVHEDLEEGAHGGADDTLYVGEDEHEAAEEDEACEHADDDAVEHDAGALDVWPGNLFDHVGCCIEACSMVSGRAW